MKKIVKGLKVYQGIRDTRDGEIAYNLLWSKVGYRRWKSLHSIGALRRQNSLKSLAYNGWLQKVEEQYKGGCKRWQILQ